MATPYGKESENTRSHLWEGMEKISPSFISEILEKSSEIRVYQFPMKARWFTLRTVVMSYAVCELSILTHSTVTQYRSKGRIFCAVYFNWTRIFRSSITSSLMQISAMDSLSRATGELPPARSNPQSFISDSDYPFRSFRIQFMKA